MSDLSILCYNCGGVFTVPYDTPSPTKQCPKCKEDE